MTVYGQNVATSLEREEVLKKDWVTERQNVQLRNDIEQIEGFINNLVIWIRLIPRSAQANKTF